MHHCCSTTLTAASQHSTTPQSFSKATVFGRAAFLAVFCGAAFWGGVSAWGSVFRRSPCNDQRNEQGEWLKVSNVWARKREFCWPSASREWAQFIAGDEDIASLGRDPSPKKEAARKNAAKKKLQEKMQRKSSCRKNAAVKEAAQEECSCKRSCKKNAAKKQLHYITSAAA